VLLASNSYPPYLLPLKGKRRSAVHWIKVDGVGNWERRWLERDRGAHGKGSPTIDTLKLGKLWIHTY